MDTGTLHQFTQAPRTDFSHPEQTWRAVLNILEDFTAEKRQLEAAQHGTLNILEDFDADKKVLEDVRRAMLNVLEDSGQEGAKLDELQRATVNILEDLDTEKNKISEINQQLHAANAELEGFSYSVSHDLRVPLRAMDGFSHMLEQKFGESLGEEGRRLIEVVRASTKRMGQLIDDILAFSRMGRKEMSLDVVDMTALALAAAEELAQGRAGRKLDLHIGKLPPARGDAAMLRQVWLNLFGNAIKFTRPKATARIEVGARTEEDKQVYYVKDNGVGFDPQYAHKLFGVFQRLHSLEEFEGTGIGLAIVKRIVARHGGSVGADGRVKEGASFYFTLPNPRAPSLQSARAAPPDTEVSP